MTVPDTYNCRRIWYGPHSIFIMSYIAWVQIDQVLQASLWDSASFLVQASLEVWLAVLSWLYRPSA